MYDFFIEVRVLSKNNCIIVLKCQRVVTKSIWRISYSYYLLSVIYSSLDIYSRF